MHVICLFLRCIETQYHSDYFLRRVDKKSECCLYSFPILQSIFLPIGCGIWKEDGRTVNLRAGEITNMGNQKSSHGKHPKKSSHSLAARSRRNCEQAYDQLSMRTAKLIVSHTKSHRMRSMGHARVLRRCTLDEILTASSGKRHVWMETLYWYKTRC